MANGYGTSTSSSTSRVLTPPSNELNFTNEEDAALQALSIGNLQINTVDMPNGTTTRNFVVNGDVGAAFTMIALQVGTQKYYNFTSGEFENGHNSNSNLIVTLSQKKYRNNIVFPEGSGDYVIKLIPSEGTTVSSGVITKSITKLGTNATITFTAGTSNAVNYATFPTTQSSGSIDAVSNVSFNWDINNWNGSTDAGSYGLTVTNETTSGIPVIPEDYWYFTTTETVNGAVSSGKYVVVDDLTDIGVGSIITGVSSGSLTGTPRVTAIDTATKTLTISSAQTFADGITLTFRAYGRIAINNAIGVDLQFTSTVLSTTPLTQTVRADSDGDLTPSTTITLNDTLGVSGGSTIKYKGLNVNNTSNNRVVSVATPDPNGVASDGAITVELAQTLRAGTILSFNQVYKTINLTGNITVNKYPTSNRSIYFDIDKIITVGTQS